jgi:DNA-binding protein HU-beta
MSRFALCAHEKAESGMGQAHDSPPSPHPERINTAMTTPTSQTPKIVGKDELSHLVATKAHVDVKEADAMLDALMETIREQVAKGRQVRLIGFGSWRLRAVSARTIKSIRGGTPIHIPAGKRVSFSTGSQLAEAAKAPAPVKKAPTPVKKASASQKALKKATR